MVKKKINQHRLQIHINIVFSGTMVKIKINIDYKPHEIMSFIVTKINIKLI